MTPWTNAASFNTYEEAIAYKEQFLNLASGALMQVKIKRYEKNQKQFFVFKVRKDPELFEIEKALSSKKK